MRPPENVPQNAMIPTDKNRRGAACCAPSRQDQLNLVFALPGLKAECRLQIDAPVVGTRAERPSGQRVALSKNRRADYAHGIPRIHLVEDISRRSGKRQTIFEAGTVTAATDDAHSPAPN